MTQSEMKREILRMKKAQNAVILAHYYQIGAIQDIADYTGDSFQLSKIAQETQADTIVFCGVHFMAETAKLLSPEKTVLLPEKDAGCPMADMATAKALAEYKQRHPDRKVVCYVNSTAEVKALSDVCVTSSNAEKIIRHFDGDPLLYVPDQNLGRYLADKYTLDIDLWPGYCCIHHELTVELVNRMKQTHPEAQFIVHPEAPLEVIKQATYVGSTKGLLDYVKASTHHTFLIGTEEGIIHQMRKHCPDKTFILLTEDLLCKNMKKTTLESLYNALKHKQFEITVDAAIAKDAKKALDLMMALAV